MQKIDFDYENELVDCLYVRPVSGLSGMILVKFKLLIQQ